MDAGRRSEDRSDEGRVEEEGWDGGGGGTGGFGDNDKGFSQFDDGGGEKGWKRKKRRRKRGWDQEVRYKVTPLALFTRPPASRKFQEICTR